ncbi:hypothetical protein RKLH11_4230 [Rhodobacteraceae bacterium KLH11]|nr:hypothetical protein RKLH11_4230 [Rhodobacteraceae bacterium KLH11]
MMLENPHLPVATEPLTDEARFSQILSPYWSSAEDYYLLTARAQDKAYTIIAGEIERPRFAVKCRYQRLRAIEDIEDLLLRYGLSDARYCLSLPEDYRLPETGHCPEDIGIRGREPELRGHLE